MIHMKRIQIILFNVIWYLISTKIKKIFISYGRKGLKKKDANSKHQINTSEFSISEKYFSMHQLMVTFSDSFIYNAYNILKKR